MKNLPTIQDRDDLCEILKIKSVGFSANGFAVLYMTENPPSDMKEFRSFPITSKKVAPIVIKDP